METQITIESLAQQRKFFDGLGKIYQVNTEVIVTNEQINEVNIYRFTPENAIEDKIILYFHGGSYAMGSINSHRAMLTHLAEGLKTTILFVEYGLAPEKPYPQGMNDGISVYNNLVRADERKIILMGDSAGGGIVVSMLASLQNQHILQPAGVILLSPWLDLRCDNPTYISNAESDDIINKSNLQPFVYAYAGGNDLDKINPIDQPLKSFPENLILASQSEVLLDDSRLFHEKVKKLQPESKLALFADQSHVWPLTNIHSEVSGNMIKAIGEFLYH